MKNGTPTVLVVVIYGTLRVGILAWIVNGTIRAAISILSRNMDAVKLSHTVIMSRHRAERVALMVTGSMIEVASETVAGTSFVMTSSNLLDETTTILAVRTRTTASETSLTNATVLRENAPTSASVSGFAKTATAPPGTVRVALAETNVMIKTVISVTKAVTHVARIKARTVAQWTFLEVCQLATTSLQRRITQLYI